MLGTLDAGTTIIDTTGNPSGNNDLDVRAWVKGDDEDSRVLPLIQNTDLNAHNETTDATCNCKGQKNKVVSTGTE